MLLIHITPFLAKNSNQSRQKYCLYRVLWLQLFFHLLTAHSETVPSPLYCLNYMTYILWITWHRKEIQPNRNYIAQEQIRKLLYCTIRNPILYVILFLAKQDFASILLMLYNKIYCCTPIIWMKQNVELIYHVIIMCSLLCFHYIRWHLSEPCGVVYLTLRMVVVGPYKNRWYTVVDWKLFESLICTKYAPITLSYQSLDQECWVFLVVLRLCYQIIIEKVEYDRI